MPLSSSSTPAVLVVILLAGCAAAPPGAPPRSSAPAARGGTVAEAPARAPQHNLSGYSPAFRQGYAAGCGSAESGSQQRDETRYRNDMDYVMGWNDGYSMCKRTR